MTRWTLLSCCLVLCACRTVTPPARPDADASGGKAAASGGPGGRPVAGAKTETAHRGGAEPAAPADARDPVPATPAVGVVQPAGMTSSRPSERAALAPPPCGVKPFAVESAVNHAPEPLRVPGHHEAPAARAAQPLAIPPLPAVTGGEAHPGETLLLSAGSLMRHTDTNAAASLSVPALRGRAPQEPRPAQTLALAFRGSPPAGQPETRPESRQIELVHTAPPAVPGPFVETVALPWLPPTPQGEAGAGRVLPLPALLPARPGGTNSAASSSLPVAPWVADAQKENDRSAAELERRARTQQEREEQFQRLRQAFYRFLSVNPGE